MTACIGQRSPVAWKESLVRTGLSKASGRDSIQNGQMELVKKNIGTKGVNSRRFLSDATHTENKGMVQVCFLKMANLPSLSVASTDSHVVRNASASSLH